MNDTLKTKKKSEWRKHLPMLFMMFVGAACGIYMVKYIENLKRSETPSGEILLFAASVFVGMYLAILIQMILHEAGHLQFGKITGYRFSSFRIGSFMWVCDAGKIKFRKLTLAGTGGQCLMSPPDMKDGKVPYVLYHMGGAIVNAITAALFALAAVFTNNIAVLSSFFMILAIVGAAFAAINGIPMRLGTVNNDGYNAISLGKDPKALFSLWVQLKCNELSVKGMRIKDMPEEWFVMPSAEAIKNSMTAALGVLICSRMMDQLEFEKAQQTIRELLEMDTGIVGLHRSLLTVDLIFCELVGENRPECIAELMDNKQKKFMKAMRKFPSVQRTEFACALLGEKNRDKAAKMKAQFERTAKSFPSVSDIESERELMAYAENRASV